MAAEAANHISANVRSRIRIAPVVFPDCSAAPIANATQPVAPNLRHARPAMRKDSRNVVLVPTAQLRLAPRADLASTPAARAGTVPWQTVSVPPEEGERRQTMMNMPGFRGEKSLYTSGAQYSTIATEFSASRSEIRPQLPPAGNIGGTLPHSIGDSRMPLRRGIGSWLMSTREV